jgi:hypothetical protein
VLLHAASGPAALLASLQTASRTGCNVLAVLIPPMLHKLQLMAEIVWLLLLIKLFVACRPLSGNRGQGAG